MYINLYLINFNFLTLNNKKLKFIKYIGRKQLIIMEYI